MVSELTCISRSILRNTGDQIVPEEYFLSYNLRVKSFDTSSCNTLANKNFILAIIQIKQSSWMLHRILDPETTGG